MPGVELVAKMVMCLVVDLAGSVDELNAALIANRPAIDLVGRERPDLWKKMAEHTRARRAQLAGKALDTAAPPAPKSYAPMGGSHGKAQGSLFR